METLSDFQGFHAPVGHHCQVYRGLQGREPLQELDSGGHHGEPQEEDGARRGKKSWQVISEGAPLKILSSKMSHRNVTLPHF